MSYRDGPFENLKVPLGLTAAFAVLVMGAIAVLLIVSDKRDKPAAEGFGPVRGGFSRATAPVSGVLAAPVRWVGHATDFIGDYFDAVDENRRLKKEVAQLEAVRDNAIALQNINRRYEALLNIRTQPPVPMIASNLVSESRGPFANAQAGSDSGTNKGVAHRRQSGDQRARPRRPRHGDEPHRQPGADADRCRQPHPGAGRSHRRASDPGRRRRPRTPGSTSCAAPTR